MVKVATLAAMFTKLKIYTCIILISTAQEHLRKCIQSEIISDLLTRFYHEWERTTSSVFPKKRHMEDVLYVK